MSPTTLCPWTCGPTRDKGIQASVPEPFQWLRDRNGDPVLQSPEVNVWKHFLASDEDEPIVAVPRTTWR